jgi:hypothetical protein
LVVVLVLVLVQLVLLVVQVVVEHILVVLVVVQPTILVLQLRVTLVEQLHQDHQLQLMEQVVVEAQVAQEQLPQVQHLVLVD